MKYATGIDTVTGDETGLASQLTATLSLSTQTIKGCSHHRGLHPLHIRTAVTRELKEQRFRATHVSRNSSPFLYAFTLTNLYCKVPFSLINTIYPRVWTNNCPMMQKVHFRLTSVPQKRYCLSSLVWVLLRPTRITTVKELRDVAYGFSCLSEKTKMSNILYLRIQRQHILFSYLRPWVLVWHGFDPSTSRSADQRLSNWAVGSYSILFDNVGFIIFL